MKNGETDVMIENKFESNALGHIRASRGCNGKRWLEAEATKLEARFLTQLRTRFEVHKGLYRLSHRPREAKEFSV